MFNRVNINIAVVTDSKKFAIRTELTLSRGLNNLRELNYFVSQSVPKKG